MVIHSEFDTNEAMNFLAISPLANMRFNMIAMMFANTTRVSGARVFLRTPLKAISDKVQALGYPIPKIVETTDISEQLFTDTAAIYWRYTAVVADDRVFANQPSGKSTLHDKLPTYMDCVRIVYGQYTTLGAENSKVEASDFAPAFFCYFDFDKIKGVEIKTQSTLLEQYFDIIKIGPIYNIYTFIVSNVLPNAASSISPAFANLLFYAVPEPSLGPFRIRDEYPETVGEMMWVYVNKKLPARYAFKLKFPDLIGFYSDSEST